MPSTTLFITLSLILFYFALFYFISYHFKINTETMFLDEVIYLL